MKILKSKPNIARAGIEEKKIYRSLAKLRRFPKVQEIFKESARLFRDGKIGNISEISKNKRIQELVGELNNGERSMYKKHLKQLGFPSLDEFRDILKSSKAVIKTVGKKKDEISQAAGRLGDEIQNITERKKPILKTLNRHIDFLGKESFFQKAHRAAKQETIIERSERSLEFYQEYALEYGMNFDFRDMLREGGIKRSNFLLGRMYFYQYIPEIPNNTFDMYPLIFILQKNEKWFEGINFHFMNPKQRAILLEHMFDYLNKQDYTLNTRILFNSFNKVLSGNRKFKYGKYCYRKYSFDSIRSKVIEVHPLDWEIAMSVPTEKFYSLKKRRLPDKVVWKNTDVLVKRNQ
tara:strand:- start:150 stop:1196 length:1047 start_codon:yes stop_codon:yes gene_type:complete